MSTVLSLLVYLGALLFAIGCVMRILTYARMPGHLRWELYPVPHEDPQRVVYGGSRYEVTDWWSRPHRRNRLGELKVMIPEILFLKGLWEFNRPLWLRSFPFHFGLYLMAFSTVLLLGGLVFPPAAPALRLAYFPAGLAGGMLSLLGASLLLVRRLADPELKAYTTAGDVFNLAFFIVVTALLIVSYLTSALRPGQAARAVLTFDASIAIPPLAAASTIAAALLLAYIPFTHMSHFIAKYFTYHSIRWDDAAGVKLAKYLSYRPAWSGKHIGADGVKTWADIATANPASRSGK